MTELIDLKTLQERHTKIHFFGLGFIQVKVSDKERFHFYHPELSAFVPPEEIHNHRYDFTSRVLKGCFEHEIYSVVDRSTAGIRNGKAREVSCDPNEPAPEAEIDVLATKLTTVRLKAGSNYDLHSDTFHRVLPATEPTITHLTRGEKKTAFATVVSTAEERVCPFSRNLEETELWDWVKKIVEA